MYLDRASLAFPRSLPEFQRLFPDDAACAAYLEKSRWDGGFVCPHCQMGGEPFRFDNRPGVLRCRKCRKNTGLTVGTVMECSHAPLSVWFWAAYLVASQTQDMSAAQFQRQLGLTATRRPSASCTSCAPAWCAPIRTGSAAGWVNMSRWTRPMSAEKHAARAEASTTRRWSPPPSRFATASRALRGTKGRTAGMPGAFASIAGRRGRPAALVHGLLHRHEAATSRLVAAALPGQDRTRSAATNPLALRR